MTKEVAFPGVLEELIPWKAIIEQIDPYYPKGERGRPPKGRELMLRMSVVQNCFDLSDEKLEDSVYEIHSIHKFVGIDIGSKSVPNATPVLKFRRLLEEYRLNRSIFEKIH